MTAKKKLGNRERDGLSVKETSVNFSKNHDLLLSELTKLEKSRKKLKDQLKNTEDLLKIQYRITAALDPTSDLIDAAGRILNAACSVEGIDSGGLYLLDEDTGDLELAASRGFSRIFRDKVNRFSRETKEALHVEKDRPLFRCREKSGYPGKEALLEEKIKGTAIIPVKYEEKKSRSRVIASLYLASRTCDLIPKKSRKILESIVSQTAPLILKIRDEIKAVKKNKKKQAIPDALDEFLFVLDKKYKIITANPSVKGYLGYSEDKLFGMDFIKLHPRNRQKEVINAISHISMNNSVNYAVPFLDSGGNEIPVNTQLTGGVWHGENILFGISRNMARGRMYEDALRESEERWRSLLQNIPDCICTVNRDGTIQSINRALPYHNAGDLIGRNINNIMLSCCPERVNESIEHVFKTGEPDTCEGTGPGPGGPDSGYYEIRVIPLKKNNKVAMVMFIIRDITERKKVREELKISEMRYRSFIQNLQGVVYLINPDWSAEILSGTSVDLSGYTLEELNAKEKKWFDIIHYEERERVFAESFPLMNEKRSLTQVYRIVTKRGETRWVEDRKTSLFSEKGDFLGINGIIFDITKRKNAEDEIVVHRNYLEELVKERTKELYESGERMRLALEATNDGLWDRYIKDDEIYFSPGWYRMLEYEPEDFIPSINLWYSLMHEKDKKQVMERLNRHISGFDDKYEAEFRLRTKSGHWKWIHSRGRVVEWDNFANALRIIGTHVDITQRKESEQKLRILERAIGSSINAICITDLECRLVHLNDSLVKMWGYDSRDEILGRDLLEIWGGEDVAGTLVRINEAGYAAGEDRGIRKDGSLFHIRFSANFILDENNIPAYYFFSFIDITENIKIREEIISSRNELHQIFNSTTTGMCIINLENRIIKANNKFLDMFNIAESEYDDIFCYDIFECPGKCLLIDFNKDGSPVKHHVRVKNSPGSETVLMVDEVPFYNHAGEVIGILADFTDITEIFLLKMEREAHEDRITKLTNDLIASQESERQRLAKDLHDSVGQIILAAKINLKEFIKNPDQPLERFDTGLRFIDQASQELREIYNDLFPSILNDIGLEAAVRQFAKQSLEIHGVECDLDFNIVRKPDQDIEVNLYRITQEIFSNIIKHSGADKVSVELSNREGSIVMDIKDNGYGFDFKEVFKNNWGLGMASIWQRVESMKGGLDIETSPGNGVRYRISVENR